MGFCVGKADSRMQEEYWDVHDLEELGLRDQGSQLFKLQKDADLFLSPHPNHVSFLGSRSFPLLHDTADSLQLLLRYTSITFCSPRQLATALNWLRRSCTVHMLEHLTASVCFIKSRCWKMGLWASFLELDIQKTTVMITERFGLEGSLKII